MPTNPRPLHGPGSERRLARLQGRFRATARRLERPARLTRMIERLAPALLVASASAFAFALYLYFTGFSPAAGLKHLAARPNCDTARALGLAEARPGEPGYWPRHDRDKDGVACEPWPW